MKITNTQAISNAIRSGRKEQDITQEEAAHILGISRAKLVSLELNGEALGSASFFSVMKAIKLAGFELHLEQKPKPQTLSELQNKMKTEMAERFGSNEDPDLE
jgi:DNA-binding XRE family transcriptional regulator